MATLDRTPVYVIDDKQSEGAIAVESMGGEMLVRAYMRPAAQEEITAWLVSHISVERTTPDYRTPTLWRVARKDEGGKQWRETEEDGLFGPSTFVALVMDIS
jgi:hypothetical protein